MARCRRLCWRAFGAGPAADCGIMEAMLPMALALCAALSPASAEDWPEWRGRGRRGEWREDNIVDRLDGTAGRVRWRAAIRAGYSGPVVARGRVFVTDFTRTAGSRGIERLVCLDERTGRELWTREWEADYAGLDYSIGPRAAPTVDGGHVYVLGARGALLCLRVTDGAVIWRRDFARDFAARIPGWGTASSPLVADDLLIAIAAGEPNAKVVALDKRTGQERWRALPNDSEPGYSQPVLFENGGRRRLIVWHAGAVVSLDPASGRVDWQHPFPIRMNTPIATPVTDGRHLLVSAFFNGARLLRLDSGELLWRGAGESEIRSDGLHTLMAAPFLDAGYIYGICSYGQLRCLRADTGQRVWESQAVTVEKARNASAHIVRHRQRYIFFNDRGELIFARLSPQGYEEISRAPLLRPTSPPGARRELGAVVWSHPAFANRHVVARNDEEIISVSLARRR